MGDGGGNSEEQIRSVVDGIRRLEEKIERVGEEIERVEEKIESVEEEIERLEDDEERMQLRDKKAQLRHEKAQLRHEKAQLRDKKAQLLPGRDKCTEYGWLHQDLPSWDSGRGIKIPGTTQKERMYTPVKVEFWDVEGDIKGFLEKADRVKRIFQKVHNLAATVGMRNVHYVAGVVLSSTCIFVNKKRSGSSVWCEAEANLPICLAEGGNSEDGNSENSDEQRFEDKEAAKCLYYGKCPRADILVKSNDKSVAVFELKNGGLGCPVRIHKLWARCLSPTGTPIAGATPALRKDKPGAYFIAFFRAKVGYGVLTDIYNWYLFKRDHTGCLYISAVFNWNDKKVALPAAVAYLINTSVDSGGEFDVSPREGERPWSWEVTPCTSPSGGPKDDEDTDPNHHPNENEVGSPERSSTRTREAYSNRRQKQLQEIPASDLHLDDRPIANEGWSGCVVGGRLNGRRVAVKLAPCKSERAEALLNEVGAYLKLQEHWGVFVPALIGHGTTAHGQIVYIAIELIDGSPLGPATVTEEVATTALQALGAVHACELLHGDVEARNIMVVRGTQPSARLVDFGFARCNRSRSAQKAEVRKLQRLLEDMMGVGMGKESDGVRFPHKRLCVV